MINEKIFMKRGTMFKLIVNTTKVYDRTNAIQFDSFYEKFFCPKFDSSHTLFIIEYGGYITNTRIAKKLMPTDCYSKILFILKDRGVLLE